MRTRLPAMASAPEAGVRLTSRSPRSIPGVRACHVAGTGNPPQSTIVLRSTLAWRRAFRNCLVLARPSAHWHASCRGQSAGALGVTCAVTSPTHRHMWRSTNDARPIGALGIRYKSTPAAASLVNENAAVDTASQDDKDKDPLDLTFCDYRNAFKSKTNSELLRALLVFHLCSIQPLVDNNAKLMKLGQKVLGKRLFAALMKATFYGHFVAGEDQIKIQPTLERLRSFGVKSILDYSVEEDISSEDAEEREME
ncbi:proline dehydrogenase isoform 2 [Penaeus vannamei]|uniref:Proline dehydrogenase n=1 Tax=Penaeus vannamei TaxID=6689 RepID=A0A3R7PX12_PENVA|nr:proline dehydrogenase isoform 2 [Penaeus vannamei]